MKNASEMVPEIVLYQPDIAQNVGSIIRMAVCFGLPIHLIEPMGFPFSENKFKRAGMDYLDRAKLTRHRSWGHFMEVRNLPENAERRLVALTTKGSTLMNEFRFESGDYLLFGRESAGLPDSVHEVCNARVRIPMVAGERSMNLAQSCAVTCYEAQRQLDVFQGN